MALRTYGDFMRAVAEGRHWSFWYRRNAPSGNSGGQWADLSFTSGNPRINAYAGSALESTVLNGNYGLWHGANVEPRGMEKYLYSLSVFGGGSVASSFPGSLMLLDYLLFYPLIDLDDPSPQSLDNVTPLPRYADGVGVRAMLVLTLSAGVAADTLVTISYTNQDGVAGRTGTASLSGTPAAPVAGVVLTGHVGGTAARPGYGPFFSLDAGDSGVRSVESITLAGAFGGFATLVLVKPLHDLAMSGPLSPRRTDFLFETKPVRIYDGAYLNLLTQPNSGAVSAFFMGDLQTVWG